MQEIRTEESPIIEFKNMTKIYKIGVEFRALDNVNLRIERRVFVAIVGPSGSCKSTLINLIGLLDTPSSGTLLIDRNNVTEMSDKERFRMRNRMLGFVSSTITCFRILLPWKMFQCRF